MPNRGVIRMDNEKYVRMKTLLVAMKTMLRFEAMLTEIKGDSIRLIRYQGANARNRS